MLQASPHRPTRVTHRACTVATHSPLSHHTLATINHQHLVLSGDLVLCLDCMFEVQNAATQQTKQKRVSVSQNAYVHVSLLSTINCKPENLRMRQVTTYVCTASSVSKVNVLPLLTWNTYNFMLNSPLSFTPAWLLHLVCEVHLRRIRIPLRVISFKTTS